MNERRLQWVLLVCGIALVTLVAVLLPIGGVVVAPLVAGVMLFAYATVVMFDFSRDLERRKRAADAVARTNDGEDAKE